MKFEIKNWIFKSYKFLGRRCKNYKKNYKYNCADWSDISMITIKDENLVDEQIAHPGSFWCMGELWEKSMRLFNSKKKI